MRDIYIGGANDDDSRIVRSYVEDQRRRHPNRDVHYYEWWDLNGIANAINTAPQEVPLNLIGHSMGGAEAIRQADATNRRIDRLVTIDPVNAHDPLRPGLRLENVRSWANVTSRADWRNWNNMVAWAGGRVGRDITDMADLRAVSGANHNEFGRMMREIGADRAIDGTYLRTQRRRTSR